nr:MAG TPA: hypothetical protein [Caudoviricetes sp.]
MLKEIFRRNPTREKNTPQKACFSFNNNLNKYTRKQMNFSIEESTL